MAIKLLYRLHYYWKKDKDFPALFKVGNFIFTRESSYCFQRVLAVAILSVRPSVSLSVTRVSVKNGAS